MLDVVIVGAGPAGLSCAIEAKKAGLSVLVLDKGSIVDSLRRFPTNLVWFSTPELLEIGNIPFVIPTTRPTRIDAIRYYQGVASRYQIPVRTHESVSDVVSSAGHFIVTTQSSTEYKCRYVVIATGYYDNPNRLGIPGESHNTVFHHYSEPFAYSGCDVAVVGGRNSAVEAALDLFRNGAKVTLIHRGEKLSDGVKYWILPDIENRIKAGEIRALFQTTVAEIRKHSIVVNDPDAIREIPNHFTFILIGFHPDTTHLARFGVRIDADSLSPCHNPETLETNVHGLYVAGSIVAGRNNNKIFIENGRLHGGKIVASILAKERKQP